MIEGLSNPGSRGRPRTTISGLTLLILVAMTFSTPGGQSELIRAVLPGGVPDQSSMPTIDRAQAEVAVRNVRRQARDQDFRGQVARSDRAPALYVDLVGAPVPGAASDSVRLLRADLLNLPPPLA